MFGIHRDEKDRRAMKINWVGVRWWIEMVGWSFVLIWTIHYRDWLFVTLSSVLVALNLALWCHT
jgi:hypothetical protein